MKTAEEMLRQELSFEPDINHRLGGHTIYRPHIEHLILIMENFAAQAVADYKERVKADIPEWIVKYNKAGHQSGAGRAIREILELLDTTN